jgi:small conductance mechanosensitive channel
MDLDSILKTLQPKLIDAGLKLFSAIAIWIIGRMIIKFVIGFAADSMTKRKIDSTLVGYLRNTVSVLFTVMLGLAIAGFLGIETTSFAAFIAAFGLAVGAVWSGMLANFAAGAFLVILRPFKAGDFIQGGGVTGTVDEIGLFVTTFRTPDNVLTFVGNNKIFSDTVQNFTASPHRRVDLTAPVSHTKDVAAVMATIQKRLTQIPNVVADPAPSVTILAYTAWGCMIAVRPSCHNDHYWQVYFDANQMLQEVLGPGGFPPPTLALDIPVAG